MTTNEKITNVFEQIELDAGPFRTDEKATTRIATISYGYEQVTVSVEDMRQGLGQGITIAEANPQLLRLRVISRSNVATIQGLDIDNLHDTVLELLSEV